jgi:hypothetical protein
MSRSRLGCRMSFRGTRRCGWQNGRVCACMHHKAQGIARAYLEDEFISFHFVSLWTWHLLGHWVSCNSTSYISFLLPTHCCIHLFLDLRLHIRSAATNSLLGRPGKRQKRGPSAKIKAMLLAGSKYCATWNHNSDGILPTTDEMSGGAFSSQTMRANVSGVSSGTRLWRINVG